MTISLHNIQLKSEVYFHCLHVQRSNFEDWSVQIMTFKRVQMLIQIEVTKRSVHVDKSNAVYRRIPYSPSGIITAVRDANDSRSFRP